jgi:hypothetical protein
LRIPTRTISVHDIVPLMMRESFDTDMFHFRYIDTLYSFVNKSNCNP